MEFLFQLNVNECINEPTNVNQTNVQTDERMNGRGRTSEPMQASSNQI